MPQPFISLEKIKYVQIDFTNKCNLLCPQCARVVNGQINPRLNLTELNWELFKKLFTKKFMHQVEHVYFNGNYGDPVAAKNILPALQYLKKGSVRKCQLSTNGSLRDVHWWRDLAEILDGKMDEVVFSIDGLEDTNHLYRVNSQFSKIMKNAKTYIESGGRARWDYLVFEHNYHQVEEARNLAKKMGFRSFQVKKTTRFINSNHLRAQRPGSHTTVFVRGQNSHKISSPSNKSQSGEAGKFNQLVAKYGTWKNYLNQTPIHCKFKSWDGIYVDFDGDVWPCGWLASTKYSHNPKNDQIAQLQKVFVNYNEGFLNLKNFKLKEIINHPWFQKDLPKSWESSLNSPNPKLLTCGRTCGSEFEYSSSAEVNKTSYRLDKEAAVESV